MSGKFNLYFCPKRVLQLYYFHQNQNCFSPKNVRFPSGQKLKEGREKEKEGKRGKGTLEECLPVMGMAVVQAFAAVKSMREMI